MKKNQSAVGTDTPRRIDKLARLRERLRDPEWRRYGYLLLGGKVLGIAMLLGDDRVADERHRRRRRMPTTPCSKGNDIVNPINTVWTLVAAFLVFGMQAGFTMLEAGFCRSRETVNVLMECVVDTCLCGLLFYAWGFAFMFGSGNAVLRHRVLLPPGRAGDVRLDRRRVPGLLALPVRLRRHLLDDHVGRHDRPHRLRRRPDLQRRRVGLHLPDHRPLGVGTGRLARDDGQRGELLPRPRHELPRLRRLDGRAHASAASSRSPARSCSGRASAGASSATAVARCCRTTSRSRPSAASSSGSAGTASTRAARCPRWTSRASAASPPTPRSPPAPPGSSAMFYAYPKTKTWDVSFTVNGFLAGLVAITCPCYWVSPTGAIMLGGIAGVIVVVGGRCPRVRCASTIRSARCRCTASAASGARCRSASSRAGSSARPGPLGGRQLGAAHRSLLRRRLHGADRADRSAARPSSRRRSCVVAGDDVRGQRLRRPARLARRASSRASTCTSTASRRTPSTRCTPRRRRRAPRRSPSRHTATRASA